MGGCFALRCKLRFHFVGDLLLHLWGERYLATSAFVRSGLVIRYCRCGISVGVSRGPCLIGSLEIRGPQIVGQPQSRSCIDGGRRKVVAIIPIPWCRSPSPAVRHRRCPRIVGPPVKGRSVVDRRNIAVISVPVVVIASIGIRVTVATIIVAPPHVRVAPTVIPALCVAASVTVTDYPAATRPSGLK